MDRESPPLEDIVYSILLRLRVKPLTRFKCVCKQWYSLISSPSFHRGYSDHQSQQNKSLIITTRYEYVNESINIKFSTYSDNQDGYITPLANFFKEPSWPEWYEGAYPPAPRPIQSCRGLLCIISENCETVKICNPSTHELVTLPRREIEGRYAGAVGFGYINSSEEFKVVNFYSTFKDKYEEIKNCQVFTFGRRGCKGWRKARRAPPDDILCGRYVAPFICGALHLRTFIGGPPYYIAAFDLQREEFRERRIPVPTGITGTLLDIGGSLALKKSYDNSQKWEIWLLKDYDNVQWVKAYTIDITPLFSKFKSNFKKHKEWNHPEIWDFVPVLMSNGSIMFVVSSIRCWYKRNYNTTLFCYDPKENVFSQQMEKDMLSDGSVAPYVESLFSLKCTFGNEGSYGEV